MILDILNGAEKTFRQVLTLENPLDADRPVVIGSNPKSNAEFDAFTQKENGVWVIHININDEKRFRESLEGIVVPAYQVAASRLYDVPGKISKPELFRNLTFDAFLFMLFHEQFHPRLCPNSEYDEKRITLNIFRGIEEAEPGLSKMEVLQKTNNCKNLIWDTVVNNAFISRASGLNGDPLASKISFVFQQDNRVIELQPVMHYPSGIVPIIYMTSAAQGTTDIPISLMGALYTSMSYNTPEVRGRAMQIFLDDLAKKGLEEAKAKEILQAMYLGIISEIKPSELAKSGIDSKEYKKRLGQVTDVENPKYEENQAYFVSTINRIFDSPKYRYPALKGLAKVLRPFISKAQKQGSPDKNTSGQGMPGAGGQGMPGSGTSGEKQQEGDGEGNDGDGDKKGDKKGKKGGKSGGDEKSQEEMDGDSMNKTLDDLIGELGGKELDELLGDVGKKTCTQDNFRKKSKGPRKKPKESFCNPNAGGGYCPGDHPGMEVVEIGDKPDTGTRLKIRTLDEYYREHAVPVVLKGQFTTDLFSTQMGQRKVWKLVGTSQLNAAENETHE